MNKVNLFKGVHLDIKIRTAKEFLDLIKQIENAPALNGQQVFPEVKIEIRKWETDCLIPGEWIVALRPWIERTRDMYQKEFDDL